MLMSGPTGYKGEGGQGLTIDKKTGKVYDVFDSNLDMSVSVWRNSGQ